MKLLNHLDTYTYLISSLLGLTVLKDLVNI